MRYYPYHRPTLFTSFIFWGFCGPLLLICFFHLLSISLSALWHVVPWFVWTAFIALICLFTKLMHSKKKLNKAIFGMQCKRIVMSLVLIAAGAGLLNLLSFGRLASIFTFIVMLGCLYFFYVDYKKLPPRV